MSEVDALPRGAPGAVAFGGIIEGRVDDQARLQVAANALREFGLAGADLVVDGGRFTWMPDDTPTDGRRFDEVGQSELLERLRALVAATADPARVSSTLRCTMTYDDSVVDTWFRVERGTLEPLSRVRPMTDVDRVPTLPRPAGALARLGSWRLLLIGGLLAYVAVIAAWQIGLVALLFGPSAEELAVRPGLLTGVVALRVEGATFAFDVIVQRDVGYPATPAAVAALTDAAETSAERAAIQLLAAGGTFYVQLLDDESNVLAVVPCRTRGLLEGAPVTVRLPRRYAAREVALALDSGQ